uniref:Phosphatidylinositol-3,4,5-trisphosphate 3-phosphatase n=1 Tax=Phaeomonas parva TaxID=124430 RepID=A0A7S1TW21_9STRA|mmetsp:Transcript_17438/g.53389  ORF Transcript_17438/g.53389 Transcript_17438/m.53389 type:complete len:424 (+) Transcript_17438:364-1635(+)
MLTDEDIPVGPLSERWHAVWCCPSCCCACNPCFHFCRKAVSNKKRRYYRDGFDLDLTYLTRRVIVHGFPATGLEHFFRNPRYELRRFLETKHAGHYRMYNFCCEPGRSYDPAVFEGRVERYPFRDHSVPPLEAIVAFNESAKAWLDADPANVVNVHCKAGKGRAGLMSIMLLFRNGDFDSIIEAREHYDATRVSNGRGLTVPSQQRYAHYYERLWRETWKYAGSMADAQGGHELTKKLPDQPRIYISAIEVVSPGPWYEGKSLEYIVLRAEHNTPEVQWRSGAAEQLKWDFPRGLMVQRNFCVKVSTPKSCCKKAKRVFEVWQNTAFLEVAPGTNYIEIRRSEVDTKRKIARKMNDDFRLRIYLADQTMKEGFVRERKQPLSPQASPARGGTRIASSLEVDGDAKEFDPAKADVEQTMQQTRL